MHSLQLSSPLGQLPCCASIDTDLAQFFHNHLNSTSTAILHVLTAPGSAAAIAIILPLVILALAWKQHWLTNFTILVTIPGGMLVAECLKLLVHRPRPFPFIESGYSFPSGHTIAATLLYGLLLTLLLPRLKSLRLRALACTTAALLILLVGFSRIAFGAHFLSDVLAAILLGSLWLSLITTLTRRRAVISTATVSGQ